MEWLTQNSNLVFGVVFFLTVILKKRIIAAIFKIQTISASEFKQLIGQKNVPILDVRSHGEYNQQHIPQAICLPLNEMTNDKLAELKVNYSEPVYVICASGNRSLWASISMKKAGVTPININGGMLFYNRV